MTQMRKFWENWKIMTYTASGLVVTVRHWLYVIYGRTSGCLTYNDMAALEVIRMNRGSVKLDFQVYGIPFLNLRPEDGDIWY